MDKPLEELKQTIEKYEQKGYCFTEILPIKSGKEAAVYLVVANSQDYALKVYKDPGTRAFQKNQEYIAGKFYREKSVRRAVAKKNKFGRKVIHRNWVRREFYLLRRLNEVGASVPKVYDQVGDTILMKFIGDRENGPAPRLSDLKLTTEASEQIYDSLLLDVQKFRDLGIVHGDLSKFNILWWNNKHYIIDFPQAVDVRQNPNEELLLERDMDTLRKEFDKSAQSKL